MYMIRLSLLLILISGFSNVTAQNLKISDKEIHPDVATGDKAYNRANYYAAERSYSKACDANIGMGCQRLARFYDTEGAIKRSEVNQLIKRDINKALPFYQRACTTLRDGKACAIIGNKLLSGDGGLKMDIAGGQNFLHHACEMRDTSGCIRLGELAEKEKKYDDASTWYFTRACKLGSGEGCFNFIRMVEEKKLFANEKFDRAKWVSEQLESLCNGTYENNVQDEYACYQINQRLIAKDPAKALDYFDTACEYRKNKFSCWELKELINSGKAGYLPYAAKYGSNYAYFNGVYGHKFENLFFSDKDDKTQKNNLIIYLSERACEHNNYYACIERGEYWMQRAKYHKSQKSKYINEAKEQCSEKKRKENKELASLFCRSARNKADGIVNESYETAFKYFQRVCTSRNSAPCNQMIKAAQGYDGRILVF
ncbi:tetratricopeptide repeat protein [Kordiimonas sp. SCSIO 12610]|uniref:tetratricopeptide repeat protein n=1 Tax=Kordiimonas sp. SCSIO 12610 TaxID=2829597 RepID=UPI0021097273|nr:hypothetical protein [Kordiimonas sp. SCSIO 12610]UTW54389.1 sel1 repeat family protein [Kordiimonas sp. SCSIO 12610]